VVEKYDEIYDKSRGLKRTNTYVIFSSKIICLYFPD
jgi:hypothetical protein